MLSCNKRFKSSGAQLKITSLFNRNRTEPATTSPPTCEEEISSDDEAVTVSRKDNPKQVHVQQQQHEVQRGKVRKFSTKWLDKFIWLAFDSDENAMNCIPCREVGNIGPWGMGGTRNFRRKTLLDHASSEDHRLAMTGTDPKQQKLQAVQQHSTSQFSEKKVEAAIGGLKAAYFCVMQEIPNCKFKMLQEWGRDMKVQSLLDLRVAKNSLHDSPETFNELLGCMSKVIERELIKDLSISPVVGIGLDESNDRSFEKHCVFIIRYIQQSTAEVKTTYLQMKQIDNGTAETLYQTLLSTIEGYCIPIRKIMSMGSDGAAVMVGRENGVAAKLKSDNPHAVTVHCICHRLNLAVSQAGKDIPEMKTLTTIVASIYNHIQLSSNRLQKFKDMAELLDLEVVKFKPLFEIRWLSLGNSLGAILRNYEPLMILLSQEADNGDPTSIGLFAQLSSFKYCALLHLVTDILNKTNHLCRVFQYRDVSFSVIRQTLTDVLQDLENMLYEDGTNLSVFKTELAAEPVGMFKGNTINTEPGRRHQLTQVEQFEITRQALIGQLTENLRNRFPRVELLHAMQIFDTLALPATEADLPGWGNLFLTTLLDHYGEQKYNNNNQLFNAVVDAALCRMEFLPFKRLIFRNRSVPTSDGGIHFLRPTELFTKLFGGTNQDNRHLFPAMYKLMSLCMIVMIGNAEAERAFSVQNRIKTKLRNRLSLTQLDRLIRLKYADLPLNEFNFQQAAFLWLQQRWRRL